ncbi:zinc metallopeptidase [bacterium]|nr:zinc metallopeptidase [bacterium]MCI0606104.1 zinc metallopeptidase [bacterium]
MRWRDLRRSENVEDRRGFGVGPVGGFKLGGCGLIVLVILSFFLGINPLEFLGILQQTQTTTQQPVPGTPPPANDPSSDFVRAVVGDTEDTWIQLFQKMGGQYEPPKLVLFRDAVQSACGFASAAVGPFYCPSDEQVYLDLGFFDELSRRFGAPGDFARAYVIAHEIGHHVQNLTGVSSKVQQRRAQLGQESGNVLSVRQELQADCFAGVWGYYANQKNVVETGDVEAALNAAAQIGDDRLQMESKGYVSPESFTHGSSDQRTRWFRTGMESGDVNRCDTFSVRTL